MLQIRRGLAAAGYPTMTFNYAYTEEGRKAPDRLDRLLQVHAAATDRLAEYADSMVLAGKSMGGRVGSHLASEGGRSIVGLVYFAYPLVPMGRGEPRNTDHLHRVGAPQLFFAGSRDRLSPPNLIGPLAASLDRAEMVEVRGGDHSFRMLKSAGRSNEDVLAELVATASAWIETQCGGGT